MLLIQPTTLLLWFTEESSNVIRSFMPTIFPKNTSQYFLEEAYANL